jgi:hypothetical protein
MGSDAGAIAGQPGIHSHRGNEIEVKSGRISCLARMDIISQELPIS